MSEIERVACLDFSFSFLSFFSLELVRNMFRGHPTREKIIGKRLVMQFSFLLSYIAFVVF